MSILSTNADEFLTECIDSIRKNLPLMGDVELRVLCEGLIKNNRIPGDTIESREKMEAGITSLITGDNIDEEIVLFMSSLVVPCRREEMEIGTVASQIEEKINNRTERLSDNLYNEAEVHLLNMHPDATDFDKAWLGEAVLIKKLNHAIEHGNRQDIEKIYTNIIDYYDTLVRAGIIKQEAFDRNGTAIRLETLEEAKGIKIENGTGEFQEIGDSDSSLFGRLSQSDKERLKNLI